MNQENKDHIEGNYPPLSSVPGLESFTNSMEMRINEFLRKERVEFGCPSEKKYEYLRRIRTREIQIVMDESELLKRRKLMKKLKVVTSN
jgi:hypothetical protein